MTASQNANEKKPIETLTGVAEAHRNGHPVYVVSKTSWYKELAGAVGFVAWVALIGLFVWAVIEPDRQIIEWWYQLGIFAIALAASMLRQSSPRVNIEEL